MLSYPLIIAFRNVRKVEERELKISNNLIILFSPAYSGIGLEEILTLFSDYCGHNFNGCLKGMLWRLLSGHKINRSSEGPCLRVTSELLSQPLNYEFPIFLLTRHPCKYDIVRNIWLIYFSEASFTIFSVLFLSLKSYVC